MRRHAIVAAITAVAAATIWSLTASLADSQPPPVSAATPWVSVRQADPVAPIPGGFIGLSMEFESAAQVTGPPTDENTVLEQLIRNLTPGQTPVLRIGGDSTDHTWFPAPGIPGSPGLTYALTPSWFASITAFAASLGARLILGVNLEADRPKVAAAEADAMLAQIGASHIEALEVGNEPDVYTALPWYSTAAGVAVAGRPNSFGFSKYEAELKRVVQALPAFPLAGPALGSTDWMPGLPLLLAAVPRLAIVTQHRYPLERCFTAPSSPTYPTISNLLSRASSTGLAASVTPYVAIAREEGRQFRIDEMNSVACSGAAGVSDTFASALWVLDTLFAFARAGVNGVNIHTFPTALYRLFSFTNSGGQWSATVSPEYYGLLMFAQAAPPGAQLLQVVSRGDPQLRAWATRTTSGATQVVLINESATTPATVTVRAPQDSTDATVELLQATGLSATGGVTIGGASFASGTTTGELTGAPQLGSVVPSNGTYAVQLPAASAALVTVAPAGAG